VLIFTEEELSVNKNEKFIYGKLYVPKAGIEPYPTVIISHGLSVTHSYVDSLAKYLVKQGFATYIFDYRGGGYGSKSSGSSIEMSVLTEMGDLSDVVELLLQEKRIDKNRLFLAGQSQGGIVSALYAANNPEKIRGLVLEYPAFDIPDYGHSIYTNESNIPDRYRFASMEVGRPYFTDTWNLDVYSEISKYTGPVLIIHGTEDSLVPISYSKKAVEFYQDADLIIVPRAGHGFYGLEKRKISKDIREFLKLHSK